MKLHEAKNRLNGGTRMASTYKPFSQKNVNTSEWKHARSISSKNKF